MMTALPRYTIRRGLPRAGRKLAAGEPVTVAYLGGSITQAWPDGYAYQTTAWLRARYPAVEITEINAGIGGTGSDLGAFRLAQDVLRHRPDLLVIEFAVNDGGETHDVTGAMEGIIRSTRRALPGCDIACLYTLAQGMLDALRAGELPPASRLHEPVAAHYGLPSINVALDACRRLDAGELTWAEFATDSCHPTARGHALYAATIGEALTEAFAQPDAPPALPAPLSADPWEGGAVLPVDPETRCPGWAYHPLENRGGWECFDGVLASDVPGSEAAFAFTGGTVGIYYRLGPETGDLLWAVDDGDWASARLFDDYAPNFWRPSYRVLATGLPRGPHTLRLRVSPERDPRATGGWTHLAALLVR